MKALATIGSAARWCVRRSLRFYYPRIEIEGGERLPATGAVLYVANHPNSLMDPALIGLVARRPVHFFAKAPLFEVPVFGALMSALGMVPAYRGQDDKAQVRRNLETLEVGAAYLKRGEAVGIFPEGKSHDREGIEQVRTGAARIAWQAVQGGATVTIVPLGLNYECKDRFRSAVWVRAGEPIDTGNWLRAHGGRSADGPRPQQVGTAEETGSVGSSDTLRRGTGRSPGSLEDERKAMRSLTAEIDLRLKQVVVHLNEERWQAFLNDLEVLLPQDDKEERDPIAALRQRKRIADAMNYFLSADRPRAEALASAIEQHRAQLAACGLTPDSAVLHLGVGRLTVHLLRAALLLLALLLPAIAGAIHHLVPFLITRGIVTLVKYPGRTTVAQNRLMMGLPIYVIWYSAVWWFIAHHHGAWFAWLWTALMPFAGMAALHFIWGARRARRAFWQEVKALLRPKPLRRLRFEQGELRRRLRRMREEYRARAG
jgi:1-acyl-sn-glycerol-3-phosphate acyltransferase